MRRTASVLTFLFVLTASAWAGCPEPPAGSTYLGTLTVSIGNSGTISASTAVKQSDVTGEICVFRTADGQTLYLAGQLTRDGCPAAPVGSTYVATLTVSTATSGESTTRTRQSGYGMSCEICVFRTADGQILYLIDLSTLRTGTVSILSDLEMETAIKELLAVARKEVRARGLESGSDFQ